MSRSEGHGALYGTETAACEIVFGEWTKYRGIHNSCVRLHFTYRGLAVAFSCCCKWIFLRATKFFRIATVGVLLHSSLNGGETELQFVRLLGGAGPEDTARAVAVDQSGCIYVAGGTRSQDFPTTSGVIQERFASGGTSLGANGEMDAFITKLSPTGTVLWSTFLGGPNYDRIYSIRIGNDQSIYVAGRAGEGFPTTPGTLQPRFAGDNQLVNRGYGKQDGFVAKLSPDGAQLQWSTYFGTPGPSIIRDMVLDRNGDVYVTMIELKTSSPYITDNAIVSKPIDGRESLVAKISGDGQRVLWCTYLAGNGVDLATSLAVDSNNRLIVAGSTQSSDFPVTAGAFQTTLKGSMDGFVTAFSSDGELEYSTYIGGSDIDGGTSKHAVAVDQENRAWIIGFTQSTDFPVTPGAFQTSNHGALTGAWRMTADRFVAIVSADGSRVEAATYLGGGARDGGEGIVIDRQGNGWLTGFTFSSDFPTTPDAIQSEYRGAPKLRNPYSGGGDATITAFTDRLGPPVYSTLMGGTGEDMLRACAAGPDGGIICVGTTRSNDWTPGLRSSDRRIGPDEIVVVSVRRE
ncbi:MAG: SBBP repeat-containing protein [Planctomycetaceae bacterium]